MKKGAKTFSFVNKPFFQGTVLFGLDTKNRMRPLKFDKVQKEERLTPVDPRLFKNFLLAEGNSFIAFSSQTNPEEFSPIKEMLSNIHFDEKKIMNLTFCKNCLDEQKFNILNKKLQISSFKNQILCSDCALKIVLGEAKLRGLITRERISPRLKNFFNHMILKFKSVNKVLKYFKPDFNPIENRDITLYDIEKNPPRSKKYLNYKVEDIEIPSSFSKILRDSNITTLLPIQAISIANGLLVKRNNQLIMAPTSAGKTLIGELAGISKIINENNNKMLYLVPIVALANVRTEEFKKKYKSLNLKIIKKVGESIFEKREENNLEDLIHADIIIATYEAIDVILRSGNCYLLGNIKTVVIDEIQTLIDLDRGFILDGLIARLKSMYNSAQFLYLSATIGEPKLLATKLNCKLIQYNNRPVPIERHLILCLSEEIKHRYILKLVRAAFKEKSKFGFKGQSIIFTNARKKCESLASYLQSRGIKVKAYHSGLSHEERKTIEFEFQEQFIAAVVATAALAAGVDFPAKQVIFESLAMGIKILTVAEFEQMLGRAGRLKKHEFGLAYLLVEPNKNYSPKMKKTEENIAISLLNGKIKDFELDPNEDKSLTELLAFISMFNQEIPQERIYEFYNFLINGDYDLNQFINKLIQLRLIQKENNSLYKPTQLGQAIAKSFLTIDQSLEIINILRKKEKSIIEIALNLKPIKNVYLSKKIVADLSKNINMKYFSNNFFSASVLSLMNAEYIKKRKKFSQEFINFIYKWTKEIFNCKCKDSPHCDCGRLNLQKMILTLRTEKTLLVEEICDYFEEELKILIFKEDIIDYLENLIYSFESIGNISKEVPNLDSMYNKELLRITSIIESIKY